MKFVKTKEFESIKIPSAALKLAKLDDTEALHMAVYEGIVTFTKKEMTAMDIAHTVAGLHELAESLTDMLKEVCGICKDCEDSGECDGPCIEDFLSVYIPERILNEAGIPADAKLCVDVDPESSVVSVTECDAKSLLSELPTRMIPVVVANGICTDRLEELLATGEVICGQT